MIDQFQAIHKAFAITLERMGFPKPSFEEVKKAVGGASQSTMEKLIGVKRAKEAVKILRPIFEKEMLNGLFALHGAYDILKDCKSRKLKLLYLRINMVLMPEQFAPILNLINTWSSQLVQMIPSGKNPTSNSPNLL